MRLAPRPASLLAPLAAVFLAPLCAAETWTLGPGDSIEDAIVRAAPGDVILLAAGEYVEAGGLVIDKPLTLAGAGADRTLFDAVTQGPFDQPLPLYVVGLAPGEEVRVVGLTLKASPQIGLSAGVLVIEDCAGPVVLSDVRGAGVPASPPFAATPAAVQVRSSAQVLLDGCGFFGASSPALTVDQSALWINATTLLGSSGGPASLDGHVGLRATRAVVRIARSRVEGGAGFANPFVPGPAGAGGVGLHAEESAILLRGGPGNVLAGGKGSFLATSPPLVGAGASAALLGAGTVIQTTPDVLWAPGPDGDGAVSAQPVDPASTGALVPGTQRLATLATEPRAATLGGGSTTSIAGEPLSIAVIGFAVAQGPALELPGFQGAIVLDLGHFGATPALALDAAGEVALVSTLPSSPTLAGAVVARQAAVIDPGLAISISPPTFQVLRP